MTKHASGGDPIHPLVDLYRRFRGELYRQCLAQLRNAADAEDAVQETFARAARHLDQLEEDPAPYLSTIAKNVCRDEMQRRARCILSSDPTMFGEIEVGHAETTTIDRDQFNMAWKRFSTRERELIGRRFAGFSYQEIAGQLQMTPGALNVALARARKLARACTATTLQGVLAVVALPRIIGRMFGRSARSGSGTAAVPSGLLAATAVTCMVVGVAGGTWLANQPNNTHVHATGPSALRALPVAGAPPGGSHLTSVAPVSGAGGQTSSSGSGSTPNTPSTLGSVASSIVSPGQNAKQQDAVFTAMTPSPDYQRDHTVYASGTLVNGCGRVLCPVLFRTQDGGVTWQHVTANHYLGGAILLPPAFPTDPVMFAAGPAGLQRSDDGGNSFHTVVPGPAPAAVDPRSPAGSARVLIAQPIPVVYDAATGRVSAGVVPPAGLSNFNDVAYGRDGAALFTAVLPDALTAGLQDGVVVRCPLGAACVVTLTKVGDPSLSLRVSPTVSTDGTVFVWALHSMDVSRDGGATFAGITLTPGAALVAVSMSPSFAITGDLAMSSAPAAQASTLLVSSNAGSSFSSLPQSGPLAQGAAALVMLPDGRELAALNQLDGVSGIGIRCSLDAGNRWTASC